MKPKHAFFVNHKAPRSTAGPFSTASAVASLNAAYGRKPKDFKPVKFPGAEPGAHLGGSHLVSMSTLYAGECPGSPACKFSPWPELPYTTTGAGGQASESTEEQTFAEAAE